MAQLSVLVAIGTAATLLATILFLMRGSSGRRLTAPVRRWLATSTPTSVVFLGLLYAIAISCFAGAAQLSGSNSGSASADRGFDARSAQSASANADDSTGVAGDLEALRAYADETDSRSPSPPATSSAANSASLPDVDTMIAKLTARLEKQPNDANGWKMLGWSYLNTGRPGDAATAYQTALKLQPGDNEIKKALEEANSGGVAAAKTSRSDSAAVAKNDAAELDEGQSDAQRNDMIRGMVDRLAARLETSPNDESGWLRLMNSRMTLGDKKAAKAALSKALVVFSSDAAARTRLAAAARELGIEGY